MALSSINSLSSPFSHGWDWAPTSTYRLQFHKGFGFRAALETLDYLHALGVGGVYSSPILRARAGSTHGYDVVDHSCLNPELGSREDFDELTRELARRGMKYLLDFVPNHMGIGGGENAWWNDVLENGPASLYADFFDIDWAPPTGTLKDKVLLAVLGSQFGEELDARSVSIVRSAGALAVRYQESSFPASPRSYGIVLERALENVPLARSEPACEELESIVGAIRHLPEAANTLSPEDRASRARSNDVMKRRLASLTVASTEVSAAIDAALRELNESAEKLEAFLQEQNYRLASWRVASDETNYRRFFDLNDLAAIRMEDARVFTEAHRLVFELIAAGRVSGLRLDHTDGLYDPAAYFSALRDGAARALAGAGRAAAAPLYVVAEKILGPGEEVPTTWAVSGTTGYDFLAAVNGLWTAPAGEAELSALHAERGGSGAYERVAYGSKRTILRSAVSSEVHMLAEQLKEIADGRRRARDFSLSVLLRVLEETLAAFPVYRSYVRPDGTRQPRDEAYVLGALATARRRSRLVDRSVFDFLRSVLLLEDRSEQTARVAMRFQQLTGPLAAKGLEDTASYRFARLLSNNEVGCDPSRFASEPANLHAHNMAMLARWPLTMTATTTHDTKRSEDVRARLAVLSELPGDWRSAVARFHDCVERYVEAADGEPAPSRLDEYFFYQSAVGAYPFGGLDDGGREAFSARLTAYMTKATHEAKLRTSWLAPHAEYDGAVARFLEAALHDAAFLKELDAFVALLLPHGASNSLAQLALRLASPGVPDIYQGTELWDLSLVDPDNRRPVDFALRRGVLAELTASPPSPARAEALVSSYRDGRVKMHLLVEALRLRGEVPDLFLDGSYRPLDTPSPHVVAFERALRGRRLVVVAPRLTRVLTGRSGFALGGDWGKQELDLGADATWRNRFTSQTHQGGKLQLGAVLQYFPVAWLDSA
ncbi:MAG: malto-oligosyltrehalose synthase [Polyangiaceae bacterium]